MSITITGVRLGLLAVLLVGGLARAQDGGTTDAAGPVDGAFPDASVPCGTVDALGECQGTTLRWCDRGRLQQEDCFTTWGSGFACHLAEPLGRRNASRWPRMPGCRWTWWTQVTRTRGRCGPGNPCAAFIACVRIWAGGAHGCFVVVAQTKAAAAWDLTRGAAVGHCLFRAAVLSMAR